MSLALQWALPVCVLVRFDLGLTVSISLRIHSSVSLLTTNYRRLQSTRTSFRPGGLLVPLSVDRLTYASFRPTKYEVICAVMEILLANGAHVDATELLQQVRGERADFCLPSECIEGSPPCCQ